MSNKRTPPTETEFSFLSLKTPGDGSIVSLTFQVASGVGHALPLPDLALDSQLMGRYHASEIYDSGQCTKITMKWFEPQWITGIVLWGRFEGATLLTARTHHLFFNT
jgi:hypothetical protein